MVTQEDERFAETLTELMWHADVPATRVQPSAVMAEGRRAQRRARRYRTGVTVVTAVAVAAGAVAVEVRGADGTSVVPATARIGSVTCTAGQVLPPPPGAPYYDVRALDGTGRYVVGLIPTGEANVWMPVLWTDGVPTTFTVPGRGGFGAQPTDVNSHGVVVGHGSESGAAYSWKYQDGEFRKLPAVPGFTNWWAYAVNERGDIVGQAWDEVSDRRVAVVWPGAEPDSVRVLDAPRNATAEDVADDGTVIGNLFGDPPADQPSRDTVWIGYVWDAAGRGRALPQVNGAPANARFIRGNLVFGATNGPVDPSQMPYDQRDRVRWNLRAGTVATLGWLPKPRTGLVMSESGLFAVSAPDGTYRIAPDGTMDRLAQPPEVTASFEVTWISPDGRRLLVGLAIQPQPNAMFWNC